MSLLFEFQTAVCQYYLNVPSIRMSLLFARIRYSPGLPQDSVCAFRAQDRGFTILFRALPDAFLAFAARLAFHKLIYFVFQSTPSIWPDPGSIYNQLIYDKTKNPLIYTFQIPDNSTLAFLRVRHMV